MTIDLSRERPITFNEAGKFLPDAARPSMSTWWRWWRHGVRGIHLETVLIGGRRYTSEAAVRRFAAALTATTDAPEPTSTLELNDKALNQAEMQRVEMQLDAAGI